MQFIIIPLVFFSIRIMDPAFEKLFTANVDASPTLSALVESLEQSDVIVHVLNGRQPSGIGGTTTFVVRAGGRRYLRVVLADGLRDQQRIALLAHELRHALEMANQPEIVDQQSMAAHYARAGHRRSRMGEAYETDAAVEAGRHVLAELQNHRAQLRRNRAE